MLRVTSCGEQSLSKANAGEGGGALAASVRASSSAQAEMQWGGGLLRTLPLLPALLSVIFTKCYSQSQSASRALGFSRGSEPSSALGWGEGVCTQVTQQCWGSRRGVHLSHLGGLFQPQDPDSGVRAQELGDAVTPHTVPHPHLPAG